MLHVDLPTRAELIHLSDTRLDACVSIYLPTHLVTQHTDIDRLEFRSLTEQAVDQLRGMDLENEAVALIEEQLGDLREDYQFWRFQSESLAVLATAHELKTYRLPSQLRPAAEVSDRYHLRPMIRAISFPGVAFVLALAENSVRLIEIVPDGPAKDVAIPGMPASLAEVVSCTDTREPSSPTGGEGRKVVLRKYVRVIDAAMRPFLSGRDIPLILDCVEPLAPIYRSVNSYPHLVDEMIEDNVEHLSPREIGDRARVILRKLDDKRLAALRERYHDWVGIGRATSDLSHVARTATAGAVHTLVFDNDGAVYGTVDDTGAVRIVTGPCGSSYDAVDEVIARTMRHGGDVVGVRCGDLPDANSPVAALLRYPF